MKIHLPEGWELVSESRCYVVLRTKSRVEPSDLDLLVGIGLVFSHVTNHRDDLAFLKYWTLPCAINDKEKQG